MATIIPFRPRPRTDQAEATSVCFPEVATTSRIGREARYVWSLVAQAQAANDREQANEIADDMEVMLEGYTNPKVRRLAQRALDSARQQQTLRPQRKTRRRA